MFFLNKKDANTSTNTPHQGAYLLSRGTPGKDVRRETESEGSRRQTLGLTNRITIKKGGRSRRSSL